MPAWPAPSWIVLGDQTLAANAATIVFSGLGGGWCSLVLRGALRSTANDIDDTLRVRFNGDATANYYWVGVNVQTGVVPAATGAVGDVSIGKFFIAGATAPASVFSHFELVVIDPFNAAKKPELEGTAFAFRGLAAGYPLWARQAGALNIVGAVTSITLLLSGANLFVAGSHATLYGVR